MTDTFAIEFPFSMIVSFENELSLRNKCVEAFGPYTHRSLLREGCDPTNYKWALEYVFDGRFSYHFRSEAEILMVKMLI